MLLLRKSQSKVNAALQPSLRLGFIGKLTSRHICEFRGKSEVIVGFVGPVDGRWDLCVHMVLKLLMKHILVVQGGR